MVKKQFLRNFDGGPHLLHGLQVNQLLLLQVLDKVIFDARVFLERCVGQQPFHEKHIIFLIYVASTDMWSLQEYRIGIQYGEAPYVTVWIRHLLLSTTVVTTLSVVTAHRCQQQRARYVLNPYF